MEHAPIAILGAGIAGLSTTHHLGHRPGTVVFESKTHHGGHIHSEFRDGFTWDDGPHISFTSNEYVKSLFAECVDDAYEEHYITASNWYQGSWIDHPAQTSLWQVPEPLRSQCVESFLSVVDTPMEAPKNYQQWLDQAMGPVFARNFPAAYTRKYWTMDPTEMDVDWIGSRILRPNKDDVVNGAKGPLPQSMYYLNTRSARYPTRGGFWAYCHHLADGADIRYSKTLVGANLAKRELRFGDGTSYSYDRLVTTLNLPQFISMIDDVPASVQEAADQLVSTIMWRVDVAVAHETRKSELWFYVYDEDKLSVRICRMEAFSKHNSPAGKTGIQVEVYGSKVKPLPTNGAEVAAKVVDELIEMGFIDGHEWVESVSSKKVMQGQVLYDLNRRAALKEVNGFLGHHGVESCGRYAEWKYLMTDACTLSGRRIANRLVEGNDSIDWSGVAISPDEVPED